MKISEEFERLRAIGEEDCYKEIFYNVLFNLCKILMEDNKQLRDAAKIYFDGYMQDEADEVECCVCGEEQHQAAKNVGKAILETDPSRSIEL